MMKRTVKNARGFTLVELLVVVGLLGLLLGAIYSVYSSHMKTAFSQEEAIDVQQNLRNALDTITQDLTMAGVMVPLGTNSIASPTGAPAFPTYSTNIRATTASAAGRFARVTVAAAASATTLSVEPPAKPGDPSPVDGFAPGDNVQIIQPVTGSSSTGMIPLVVASTNRTTNPPTVTFTAGTGGSVNVGDMLAKTADASTLPHTIDYYLVSGGTTINGYTCPNNQKCLVRQVNGTGATPIISQDIIATDLSSLRFSYLDDNAPEAAVPANLATIRAVRVTLQGATTRTSVFSGGARNRAATTIIKLRNRR